MGRPLLPGQGCDGKHGGVLERKSPYAALEKVGVRAVVVNARHAKTVPGRKTDWADAQWLATLARTGLLRGSYVPPANLRELRLVARQRQQLTGVLAGEKNRLHKVLSDGGIRLSAVVSDIHGVSARAMVKALIDGQDAQAVLKLASQRLKADPDDLLDALDGELTARHRFVLAELMEPVEDIERRIARFDRYLLDALKGHVRVLTLLQTVPGIDLIGAALLLVEIGDDMSVFGSPDRLASWVGVCPGNHESAGKRKAGRTRKGNPWVRRLLCQFAHPAAQTRCAMKSKFEALRIRRSYKRALVAIAHKMLKTVFLLISRNMPYRDAATDYEAFSVQRNAPRWIKMLQKHGYLADV